MRTTYPLVVVTWLDHTSVCSGWVSEEAMHEHIYVTTHRTVGWLVKETDQYYAVASTIEDADDDKREYDMFQTCVKGAVLNIEYLTPKVPNEKVSHSVVDLYSDADAGC